MADIRKFYADVQRCLKRERAEALGGYDGLKAAEAVARLFASCNKGLELCMQSLADYWLHEYIEGSAEMQNEPTGAHIDWLAAALSLFGGESENLEAFSKKDWQEIAALANAEAENMPLDVLSSVMAVLVERQQIV